MGACGQTCSCSYSDSLILGLVVAILAQVTRKLVAEVSRVGARPKHSLLCHRCMSSPVCQWQNSAVTPVTLQIRSILGASKVHAIVSLDCNTPKFHNLHSPCDPGPFRSYLKRKREKLTHPKLRINNLGFHRLSAVVSSDSVNHHRDG